MDDLISRSALLEQECFMDDDNGFRCSVVLSTDVRRAPAVDAVEVVRCKDCRYLKTCSRTIELIPRQAQIGYLRCVVHSCEYGERRSDT